MQLWKERKYPWEGHCMKISIIYQTEEKYQKNQKKENIYIGTFKIEKKQPYDDTEIKKKAKTKMRKWHYIEYFWKES